MKVEMKVIRTITDTNGTCTGILVRREDNGKIQHCDHKKFKALGLPQKPSLFMTIQGNPSVLVWEDPLTIKGIILEVRSQGESKENILIKTDLYEEAFPVNMGHVVSTEHDEEGLVTNHWRLDGSQIEITLSPTGFRNGVQFMEDRLGRGLTKTKPFVPLKDRGILGSFTGS